jgi:hypothetical protein
MEVFFILVFLFYSRPKINGILTPITQTKIRCKIIELPPLSFMRMIYTFACLLCVKLLGPLIFSS